MLPAAVAGTGTGTAAEYIGELAGAASLVFLDKATCMLYQPSTHSSTLPLPFSVSLLHLVFLLQPLHKHTIKNNIFNVVAIN